VTCPPLLRPPAATERSGDLSAWVRGDDGWAQFLRFVLVGGTSTDPFGPANKGRYSSLARFQECILTALYRGAILGQAPDGGA